MKKRLLAIAATAGLALATFGLTACSGSSKSSSETTSGSASAQSVDLKVFAAKSLQKSFDEINTDLIKKNHPELNITFSFEGSSTLVDQIKNGAPADVFASADQKNMDKATAAGLVEDEQPFASNVLALIVPAGNPGKITGLDSSLDGKKFVICADGVPCGNATRELAKKLGFTLNPSSEEQNVGDVRSKVESGEADAGLVYITDAKNAGDKVEVINVDGIDQVVNAYPISIVKTSKHKEAAKTFIDTVLSDQGQAILAKYGFRGPTSGDQK